MNQFFELPEATFSKSFRGYSVNDVEAYLQHIHELSQQNKQFISSLQDRMQSLEKEITRLQEAENALIRALNLSEEAKDSLRQKVDEEKKQVLQAAESKAIEMIDSAKKEVDKLFLVFEQEKNQQKDQLKAELIEQERTFKQLKEAQKLIASQLMDISKVTIHKIEGWEKEEVRSNKEEGRSNKGEGEGLEKRRGRPSGSTKGTKPASKKTKKKIIKAKKVTVAEGQKKSPGRPKKVVVSPEMEDGLPTLGKVLEAYAKSNQPKGKIADIN